MNTYEIEVNLVNALGSTTGKALQVSPQEMPITLSSSTGVTENALVTWTFKNLPTGLTPVIAFESGEVIASGPTTTLGAAPRITFEIRFPASVDRGPYSARYKVSTSSSSTKQTESFPAPVDSPCLVVIRSPDPPPPPPPQKRDSTAHTSSHAKS
jgi:hypothetical protein